MQKGNLRYIAIIVLTNILFSFGSLSVYSQIPDADTTNLKQRTNKLTNMINELCDVEMVRHVLQVRRMSNVGTFSGINGNTELKDSITRFRRITQIDLFLRTYIQSEHFWAGVLNRKNPLRMRKALRQKEDTTYLNFEFEFTPENETKGSRSYKVKTEASSQNLEHLTDEQVDSAAVFVNNLLGEIYKQPKDAPLNEAMIKGIEKLLEMLGYEGEEQALTLQALARFYDSENSKGGFDLYDMKEYVGTYDQIKLDGKSYYIPWKAVKTGQTDHFNMGLKLKEGAKIKASDVKLKSDGNVNVLGHKSLGDTLFEIEINAASKGEYQLHAEYQAQGIGNSSYTHQAGYVNVLAYDEKPVRVKIVALNGYSLNNINQSEIVQKLKALYAPAIVKLEIEFAKQEFTPNKEDWDKDNNGIITFENSGELSAYPKEMRKITSLFKDHAEYSKDYYYLFVTDKCSKTDLQGFMPLKRQFGFIFMNNIATADVQKIMGHELGHGMFALQHNFARFPALSGKKTPNLMGYDYGSRLRKFQWEQIHNPNWRLYMFQDEEEGAFVAENNVEGVARFIRSFHCAKNKGKSSELLYLGKSQYEIKISNLVEELGISNPSYASERIKFTFGEDAGAGTDYFQDVFDIKNVEYDDKNKWVKIKGQELSLTVRWIDYYTPEKDNVYSFIKSLFNGAKTIKTADEKPDELSVEELEYCSVCTFEKIGIERRKKLLSEISGYNWIYDPQEKVVINLVNSCPAADKLTLFNYMKGDADLMSKLYDGVDDYRKEFMNSLVVLYGSVKDKATGINHVAYAKLGSAVKDDGSQGVYSIYRKKGTTTAEFSGTGINFILKEKLLIEYEWSLPGLFKNQNGETIFTALPFDIIETELTSIEIGKFYTNVTQSEVAIQLPAIYVKYLLDEQISQLTKNELSVLGDAGMNIAMFVVGVGELKAGVTALKATTNAQGVIRLVLGSADLLALGTSNYCDGSTSEFCKAYKEYEFYINLGLLSGSVLNNVFPDLYTRLKNSYKDVPMSAQERKLFDDVFEEGTVVVDDLVGTYTTKIRWGIHDIDARPLGDKGYWGKRITQNDTRVNAFELKINPNNESFYVPHPNGGYVQFEGLSVNVLQDGKLIKQVDNSIYNVYDKPEFLRRKILDEANRQVLAAESKGLSVEWLVSEQKAVDQLSRYFRENNINITVKYLAE